MFTPFEYSNGNSPNTISVIKKGITVIKDRIIAVIRIPTIDLRFVPQGTKAVQSVEG